MSLLSNSYRLIFAVLLGYLLYLSGYIYPLIAKGDEIKSFDCDIAASSSGSLLITEEIVIDFQKAPRHEILRLIPLTYKRGSGIYSINLKMKEIVDESGKPVPYHMETNGPDLNITIGDFQPPLTGRHVFKISYQASQAFTFLDGVPALTWNVTGYDWPCPIDKCMVSFHAPLRVPVKEIRPQCFAGAPAAKKPGKIVRKEDELVFSAEHLGVGQGLTIELILPKGSIAVPSIFDTVSTFVEDWFALFAVPVLTSLILYIYWNAFGRDRRTIRVTGIEVTPPPGLSPAEVGTLMDERCETPDVISTLVDLASRGYLHIKPIPYNGILLLSKRDYQFTKKRPGQPNVSLKAHEIIFLNALFRENQNTSYLSGLKGKFLQEIPDIKRAIWAELTAKRLFTSDPETERQVFYLMAALMFLGGIGLAVFGGDDNRASGLGFIVSGMITAFAANAMPARTPAGSQALARCRAFQRFVQGAEKNQVSGLLKDDPAVFGRFLPYAIVLGAADHWANAFKDLMVEPPDWYDNSAFGGRASFSAYAFVDDLGDSLKAISSGFTAEPMPVVTGYGASETAGEFND
jgi:hypothetical protein